MKTSHLRALLSRLNNKYLSAVAVTLLVAIFTAILFSPVAAVLFFAAIVALGVLFKVEIFDVPKLASDWQSNFDSVSRLVYSGTGTASIFDFNISMQQARARTLIGRTKDSGKTLGSVAEHTFLSAQQMTAGISKQRR